MTQINKILCQQLFNKLDEIDYSCTGMTIDTKSDDSFVTNIDYQANATIEDFFNCIYGEPQVNIISEENSNRYDENKQYNIVVDPIDGTENLTNGIPIFGVSISIYKDGDSHYHILYFPLLKQQVTSDDITEESFNKHRESRLTLLSSNSNLDEISEHKGKEYRIYGCATYNMYAVIANQAYMYTNSRVNSYDILAGINIAKDIDGVNVYIDDELYQGEFLHRDKQYRIVMRRD